MEKIRVLFVCIHNSARSQMAEELLKKLGGTRFHVSSAGLEPGKLNPYVVEVLKNEGIDISNKTPQAVDDLHQAGVEFDYVITVCDTEAAERCPIFPGGGKRLHWSFRDPSKFTGTHDEIIRYTSGVKLEIETQLRKWLSSL